MTMTSRTVTSQTGTPIAERVLDLLVAQERPRSWLARKAGVSDSHLHRVLTGERPLTRSLAGRMADVLGVPVETFIEEESDE